MTHQTCRIEVVPGPLESLDRMGMPTALPDTKGGLMAVLAGIGTGEHGRNGYRRAPLGLLLEIIGRFPMGFLRQGDQLRVIRHGWRQRNDLVVGFFDPSRG